MDRTFPIINRPDRQPRSHRWLFHVLTTFAWALWFYLWLPAVTLFAWAVGYELAGNALVRDVDRQYLTTLLDYGGWIAVLALVFMLWSAYNRSRFRGRNRRREVPRIDVATIAADLPLSESAIRKIMDSRKVRVSFDEHGYPYAARVAMTADEIEVRVE